MIIKLKKSLGQHLLIASGILEKIAEYAKIKEGDILVEIGPGTGNLTSKLLKYPLKKLYLIEIDEMMIAYLKEHFKDKRLVIIKGNAINFDYKSLNEYSLKVVGNLPYNVANLIIENIIFHYEFIPFGLFLVQKEVGEKWLSRKSWLSNFINIFYDLEYLMTIPPRFFKPPPKVDSALIRFNRAIKADIKDLKLLKNFLTQIYQQKRKVLRKKLSPLMWEKRANLANLRVEDLSLEEILSLFQLWQELHQGKTFPT